MDPFVAEIRIFPFNFAPIGWAFCDGQLLSLSQNPALFSLVGTTYGLAHQTLGAVSLLGPLRMDYEKALHSVRAAAYELSRFVEDVYGDD